MLRLNLGANNAGAESADALCRLLAKNTTLRRIDLAGNHFAGSGEAIREALWRNAHLHTTCGCLAD